MHRRSFISVLAAAIIGLRVRLSAQGKGQIHGIISTTRPPLKLTLSKVTGFLYTGQKDPRVFEVVATGRVGEIKTFSFPNLSPGVYRLTIAGIQMPDGHPVWPDMPFQYDIDDLEITEKDFLIRLDVGDSPLPLVVWQHHPEGISR